MTKLAKPWKCDECGRRMTEKQAVRAMEKGCPKGCSGLDVHEVFEAKREMENANA